MLNAADSADPRRVPFSQTSLALFNLLNKAEAMGHAECHYSIPNSIRSKRNSFFRRDRLKQGITGKDIACKVHFMLENKS
ncbi:hypothetical protein [Bradyrhizobium sp. USDA 4506]